MTALRTVSCSFGERAAIALATLSGIIFPLLIHVVLIHLLVLPVSTAICSVLALETSSLSLTISVVRF